MIRTPAGRLRGLGLVAHAGLAVAVSTTLLTAAGPGPTGLVLTVIALVPLAATLPGLVRGHKPALRWLALVLVLFTGLGSVEVIAGGTPASVALLFFALLELGLVLMLSRLPAHRAPAEPGES